MHKVLVTGSSGMIGTRLCEKLLDLKFDVIGIDVKHNPFSERVDKITKIVDLRSKSELVSKMNDEYDIIVHLAANARVYDLIKNPDLAIENIITTFNILEFARLKKVKKLIFSSSREVYGNSKDNCSEKFVDINSCENNYSASKISSEVFVRSYNSCFNIDFIILRLSNVYGMYDISDRVIPTFVQKILEKKELVLFGGKNKMINFVYIDDVVDVIVKCINDFGKYKNDVYNVASYDTVNLFELSKMIQEILGISVKVLLKDNRPGETMHYFPDISKIKKVMNWRPNYSFNDGLKNTIKWYKDWFTKK